MFALTDATSAVMWRDAWIDRAAAIGAELDLGTQLVVASDAFFGRGGNAARRKPARPAPQARVRHAYRQ